MFPSPTAADMQTSVTYFTNNETVRNPEKNMRIFCETFPITMCRIRKIPLNFFWLRTSRESVTGYMLFLSSTYDSFFPINSHTIFLQKFARLFYWLWNRPQKIHSTTCSRSTHTILKRLSLCKRILFRWIRFVFFSCYFQSFFQLTSLTICYSHLFRSHVYTLRISHYS